VESSLVETVDISAAPAERVRLTRASRTRRGVAGSIRPSPYRAFGKRALDIAFVILSAPVVVPLVALIAVVVSLDGASPFYRQSRVGRHGSTFRMLKLRSMVPNAEDALQDVLDGDPTAAREWESHQKLRDDPRVTLIGSLLRRSSLDELPQLWNVLRGDMSLVGPRPIMVNQTDLYGGTAYFSMRPGITGLWQVSARNQGFHCRVEFDQAYYENLSLGLDLRTLMRTAVVVLRGTGW
jgi:lipopolysaccharide/colanic/teichoic acid biosynthesis glycosyltransferase